VSSREAPFYQQASLGGSSLLRGFTEGRFVDLAAWTLELEQRLRVLSTEIFRVRTDWRVDPFVATGQVFDRFADVVSRPRFAAGVGFRAFVHPNIVGRIDVALADEGLKVYVEIGYPY
jgi:hemolysin activation/secretion protein